MDEMSEEEFNYWEQIVYYQEQGYSKEDAENLAYADMMEILQRVCAIIDSK